MPKQQEPHSIQAWSLINRKYLGKGIRVKRFRKPSRCQIRNRVLLAVLMANDIKLSQLAEDISVSSRSVSAWVYEGRIPGKRIWTRYANTWAIRITFCLIIPLHLQARSSVSLPLRASCAGR